MTSAFVASDRWIVLKFGGTSVSRRHRWDTIGNLAGKRAEEEGARVLVVVSALSGVTNELTAIAAGATDTAQRVEELERRHREFATELQLDPDAVLGERLAALRALALDSRAASRALDWQAEVLAQGELLSSILGAAYLRSQGLDLGWMDARQWLEASVQPNQSEWARRLSGFLQPIGQRWLEPCFPRTTHAPAADPRLHLPASGRGTAVLGRGGSDTSAGYFGALLGAQRVEIWTDVPGMFSANPREVPDARLLTRLDYHEAQEIATTGAKVLHPRSIKPCRDARVPMTILDTERPHMPGTRIDDKATTVPGVKAISRRDGIVLVSMEDIGMWQQVGFLADVFARFKKHGLSVDLIGSAETNVTVSLDPSENLVSTDVLAALSADLSEVCRVKVIVPCTAITLVGRGMRSLLHKLSEVWAAFGQERVHMISQSSNDLNLTFVIDEVDADGLLPMLHEALIDSGAMPVNETEVFGTRWREISGTFRQRPTPWWHGQRDRLLDMAGQGTTPRYVYHLPTVRARARALKSMASIDRHYYAIKANSHPTILATLVQEGFGLECVSQGELEHVFATLPDLSPDRVLFTPSFAPHGEYAFALEKGVTLTLDNVEALRRWPDTFRGRRLWLRVDLGRGDGHHDKVKTGGKNSKFGLPLPRLEEFLSEAKALDIAIVGLHAHLGSGVETPQHWRQVCDELGGIAERIGSIESIDIGGGLPIPYTAEDEPFDLEAWDAGLAEIKKAYPGYQLVIEPGRYMVAESGVLLTRVTQVVEKDGVHRVGVDAGIHTLLRAAMYDAWHDIANLDRLSSECDGVFDVVGPICESSDVFGKQRRLPAATDVDDVMLIADAGAYGYVMASHYNLRGLPAQEMIDEATD